MVVSLIPESMFSNCWFMMLQKHDFSQSLWLVKQSSKVFWNDNCV